MGEEVKEVVPEQRGSRSEFYREITPSSFWGGVRPGFIEAIAVTSRTNAIELMINNKVVVEHVEEICIKLTPQQAKSLYEWLGDHIDNYEKRYGSIRINKDE